MPVLSVGMSWPTKVPRWPWRRGPGSVYRKLVSLGFLATRDRAATWAFLTDRSIPLAIAERARLVGRFIHITNRERGYHTLAEMLEVASEILRRRGKDNLVVVEAGAAYGSSTAKLSLATARAGGTLHVFDTFRGIPENDEVHRNLFSGREVRFHKGAFWGTLSRVRRTVATYGAIDCCQLHKGLFDDTLPTLDEQVDVALIDVDLVSSTRSCLLHLMPRLAPDGVLFSQDGQLEATHELLRDASFWLDEVGVPVPRIDGLGSDKLLVIRPASAG